MSKKKFNITSIQRAVLLVESSYGSCGSYDGRIHPVLTGYEVVMATHHMPEDLSRSYQALVFVNYGEKEIIIANSGSRYSPLKLMVTDLFDALRFSLGYNPYNVGEIIKVNEMLLHSLGAAAAGYRFHYTGHSMGGVVAQIGAVHMKKSLASLAFENSVGQVSSITFENPGAKNLIEKLYGLGHADISKDFLIFNNRKNFINSFTASVGETCTIIPHHQKPLPITFKRWICTKLKQMVSKSYLFSWFTKLFELGEMGILQLQKDHALDWFKKVLVQQEGAFVADKLEQHDLSALGSSGTISPQLLGEESDL